MTYAVEVHDVGRKFKKYYQMTMKEFLTDRNAKKYNKIYWALRNVTFNLEAGSTLGLIGRNGSGKSTLLKIISGVISPSEGYVKRPVATAALLELGAGFQPDMTGRENIFLNSAILGRSRKQTQQQLDSIIEFSGIEEFIDTPVKFYSSGMYTRLGFSIAIHTDPELLLVDEVLAVGDEPFQQKCLTRIKSMQADGRSIILVTHSEEIVKDFCNSAVLLDHGHLRSIGNVSEVISEYQKLP